MIFIIVNKPNNIEQELNSDEVIEIEPPWTKKLTNIGF